MLLNRFTIDRRLLGIPLLIGAHRLQMPSAGTFLLNRDTKPTGYELRHMQYTDNCACVDGIQKLK
jgi:hypothetical protein